jgi:hypothetical protein
MTGVLKLCGGLVAGVIVIGALIAPPASAQGLLGPAATADMDLDLRGASHHDVRVGRSVTIVGSLKPFVPGQVVDIKLERGDNTIRKTEDVPVTQVSGKDEGTFSMRSPRLIEPGAYRASAEKKPTPEQDGASAVSDKFTIDYPSLGKGRGGKEVAIFNNLLDKQGYYPSKGKRFTERTARAVMAFRKVNRMARKFKATPGIFRKLAADKGAMRLKFPGRGRHVEVDISRQVMALADDGKPKHTFHVSTGAPATPSDKGSFRFYRKDAGFNSIGMFYSVYYNRGEATHGYKSVPTYPASHGCIRNPIPDSRFIYNWINLGMNMSVYR